MESGEIISRRIRFMTLLTTAGLLLSVTLSQAEPAKGQTPAPSLADVSLKPGAKLLVILNAGEKIKGEAINIAEGILSVSGDYRTRTLSEGEIYQVFQVKGLSRGRGALIGVGIGGGVGGALLVTISPPFGWTAGEATALVSLSVSIGVAIGVLVTGHNLELVFQNPSVSPPSGSKTGLLNFSDGRLSFNVPSTYYRPDIFEGFRVKPSEERTKHIDLAQIDF